MPKTGNTYRVVKNSISIRDLAYLSAATMNEFAVFRGEKEDILIRGNSRACEILSDLCNEIIKKKYEWIAHSHVDRGALAVSIADRERLKRLGQKKSIIVGIDGIQAEFYQSVLNIEFGVKI